MPGENTTDPVCGMMINADDAVARSHYEGRTYYFCTDRCRIQFEQDPTRYAGRSSRPAG